MMADIIKIENLSKSYGQVKAVQNLSFKVKEGELFAFLGVNGAGKSTTISVMCGTLLKDSGKVYIDGVDTDGDTDEIKRKIGVVFQNSVLDKSLSARDNLEHRAALYGITDKQFDDRLDQLIKLLDFKEFVDRPISKLSGGQKRKIDIARALIHNPKILILDEPTTGLDPQTRAKLWSVVESLRKNSGMTVFLTTHYMEEAADADYVVIIDGGKIAAEGTPHELKNIYTGDYVTVYGIDKEQADLLKLPYEEVAGAYRFAVPNTRAATELIISNPSLFNDYEVTKGKMDDVFLKVTGKNLTEDGQ
ncbi:MAG: ABC transporter ATP-binding protein [Clostridia bacterium]|nr:ABC transporter ATP-binding protein [Clostridia bacterium]